MGEQELAPVGGASLAGVLPGRMRARFAAALADPEALSLASELALLDARLADVLGRVDSGESGRVWSMLRQEMDRFRLARAEGKAGVGRMQAALAEIERLIDQGLADTAAWADVRALIQQRQQVVESERRRAIEARQVVRADEALLLAHDLALVVKQVVEAQAPAAIARTVMVDLAAAWRERLDAHERAASPGPG